MEYRESIDVLSNLCFIVIFGEYLIWEGAIENVDFVGCKREDN